MVRWDLLLPKQRHEFLDAFRRGVQLLGNDAVLDALVHRRGLFDIHNSITGRRPRVPVFSLAIEEKFKHDLRAYADNLNRHCVYGYAAPLMAEEEGLGVCNFSIGALVHAVKRLNVGAGAKRNKR